MGFEDSDAARRHARHDDVFLSEPVAPDNVRARRSQGCGARFSFLGGAR